MNSEKNNHAITLIALIITIIILLILAGVTINVLIGKNGLFNTASYAGEKYQQAGAREKLEALLIELQADKITKPEDYNENEYINNKLKENKMTVNGDLVTVNGWQFLIDRTVPKIIEEFGEEDKIVGNVEKIIEYGQDIPLYEYLKKPSNTKFMYNGIEIKNTKELPVGEWTVTYNKETKVAQIESIDNVQIEDLSGQEHTLYLKNGIKIKKDEQANYYLGFDGQNDYGQIMELEETIDWANGFSVEFEATWEAFNDWSRILDFGNGAGNDNIIISNYFSNNELLFEIWNGYNKQGTWDIRIPSIILNEKSKYVIRYEKNEDDMYKITFYKNEEEIFTKITNYTLKNILRTSNYLGRPNWSENAYFNGKIYSLKITEADGDLVLWYDMNKYLEKYEIQNIKVVGEDYTGKIADISGKEHILHQKSGAKVKKDENNMYYLSFDGQDDYGQIMELEETIDWANGFSIEFEATWEAFNQWSRIFDFGNGPSNNNILVANRLTTDNLILMILNGASQETHDFRTSTITLNEKSKYAIKYEKNESNNYKITFYENGEEIYNTVTNYTVNNVSRTSNYLGKSNWSGNGIDQYFKGRIYSLKITEADGDLVLWYDINKWIEMSK